MTDILKWIATIFVVSGGWFVSISISLSTHFWPYILFGCGHILWSVFAYRIKDMPLFWLNIGLIPLDIYAIYIRL